MTVARLSTYALIGTAAAVPIVAPWPLVRALWARITGDSNVYAVGVSHEEWQQRVLWLGMFAILALVVGARSLPLGGVVMLLGLNVALRATPMISYFEIALVILAVVILSTEPVVHPHALAVVGAAGLLQALYIIAQRFGFDPLIGPSQQTVLGFTATGTLGNRDISSGMLALAAPLVPWWALAVIIPALALTKCAGALLAVVVGLSLRFKSWTLFYIGMTLGTVALTMKHPESLTLRWYSSLLGLEDWLRNAPLIGHGLGGWEQRKPGVMSAGATVESMHHMVPAHNDILQWNYETGLLGAGLLAYAVWMHRSAFSHPLAGPALSTLVVLSFTEFPFHAVSTALAGAIVIGVALTPHVTSGDQRRGETA